MYNYYRRQCPPGTFPYKIKAGDNFYRLAIGFNTTIPALIGANPTVNPTNLQIGQNICIPRQRIYPACPEGNYYTIKGGDTLYSIARRFNVSLDDVIEANPGINPYMLMIGQVICIPLATPPVQCPPDTTLYTIKSGDTFYSLSQRFNTTVSALIDSNPGINYRALLIGQKICIPNVMVDLPETKEIPVFVEGETEYRNARLRRSEQGYYIYVLDNYEFFAEEPGSDVLVSNFDDRFFVRIQKLTESANIADLKDNAIQTLRNIGTPTELSGSQILDPFFRENEFFFNAYNEEISVNIFVKEMDGELFRFIMFLPSAEAAEGIIPSFYAMLKTIEVI